MNEIIEMRDDGIILSVENLMEEESGENLIKRVDDLYNFIFNPFCESKWSNKINLDEIKEEYASLKKIDGIEPVFKLVKKRYKKYKPTNQLCEFASKQKAGELECNSTMGLKKFLRERPGEEETEEQRHMDFCEEYRSFTKSVYGIEDNLESIKTVSVLVEEPKKIKKNKYSLTKTKQKNTSSKKHIPLGENRRTDEELETILKKASKIKCFYEKIKEEGCSVKRIKKIDISFVEWLSELERIYYGTVWIEHPDDYRKIRERLKEIYIDGKREAQAIYKKYLIDNNVIFL